MKKIQQIGKKKRFGVLTPKANVSFEFWAFQDILIAIEI